MSLLENKSYKDSNIYNADKIGFYWKKEMALSKKMALKIIFFIWKSSNLKTAFLYLNILNALKE